MNLLKQHYIFSSLVISLAVFLLLPTALFGLGAHASLIKYIPIGYAFFLLSADDSIIIIPIATLIWFFIFYLPIRFILGPFFR